MSKSDILKPIFHQNAKYLTSGVGVGQCPRRQNFAWEIPTCWYILALPPTPFPDANPKICVTPTPTFDASQWNIGSVGSLALGLCIGHVHFIFFVLISFASDTRRKPVFQWNMGFSIVSYGKMSLYFPNLQIHFQYKLYSKGL